jgi:hypothetical protein
MTGGGNPPPQPPGAQVPPDAGQLQNMDQSACQNASPAQGGVQPCPKKSWFAIRVIDDKDAVVEGLTLKLKLPVLGEIDRVTSKAVDPVKIDQLDPGGKGDAKYIDAGEVVWEAIGDIT